jgi:hypothetical protein
LVQNSRKYDNIIDFTGLLVLDFDHLDKDIAIEFKEYLFNKYQFIYSVWLSASRHGVRAIVKIPKVKCVDEFKHYFAGIEKKLCGYNGFDTAPKNCILPMFISYDQDILIRDNPIEWQTKYIPVVAPPVKQYIVNDKSSAIEKIIAKKIIPIIDNGHPQLRAAAYLMGGYSGAGYIDRDQAITILHNLIESNAYLSQKAAIYKRTACEMIDKGINQPTFLPTN